LPLRSRGSLKPARAVARPLASRSRCLWHCRYALAALLSQPAPWRDHWRAARDAFGIAATLSRLLETSPRQDVTTGETLAMPSALPLRSRDFLKPARAVARPLASRSRCLWHCRYALATPGSQPAPWRDHWRAARDAFGIAATLSRPFEASPRQDVTTGETLSKKSIARKSNLSRSFRLSNPITFELSNYKITSSCVKVCLYKKKSLSLHPL